jgi:hypothetical protein
MPKDPQPAGRLRATLISNGIAAAALIGLAIITFMLDWFVWMGILSVAPVFVPCVLVFSLMSSLLTRKSSSEVWGWCASIAISWALTAPLGSWLDHVMVRADPGIYAPGPEVINAALWYWALIPVLFYAVVGVVRYRHPASNAYAAASQR